MPLIAGVVKVYEGHYSLNLLGKLRTRGPLSGLWSVVFWTDLIVQPSQHSMNVGEASAP